MQLILGNHRGGERELTHEGNVKVWNREKSQRFRSKSGQYAMGNIIDEYLNKCYKWVRRKSNVKPWISDGGYEPYKKSRKETLYFAIRPFAWGSMIHLPLGGCIMHPHAKGLQTKTSHANRSQIKILWNKPNSQVKGDLPKKIIRDMAKTIGLSLLLMMMMYFRAPGYNYRSGIHLKRHASLPWRARKKREVIELYGSIGD